MVGFAAILLATPAAAATYAPTGVQTNVSLSTVTGGGWTECFSSIYGQGGQSISTILAGCTGGSNLMLAARATGSDTLLLLAQAPIADVIFNTGSGNATHNANGVEWYFSEDASWGFAPGGAAVVRDSCDTVDSSFSSPGGPTSSQRLCWHTSGNNLNGGWRAGSFDQLNGSADYERLIFVGNLSISAVPEPSTWAMLIAGFGLIGATMRRGVRKLARA